MMRRTLIHGARQIVTVTREHGETCLRGKAMHDIGVLKSTSVGLSLVIEK